MEDINLKIPVEFQKIGQYENKDTRFISVKIWLMHLGNNLNGSYFTKESVQKAIPTLSNTPILAYVEKNSDDEDDFSDHRSVIVRDGDDINITYVGKAIGVIPETNNAKFEMRMCEDNIEREFLTCEGLVWTKWDDVNDIFERDSIKSESMELSDKYTGHWNKDNYFEFDSFEFNGACALGKDVSPAMINATIEVQFTTSNIMVEIENKLNEYYSSIKKKNINETEKEDNELEENKNEKTFSTTYKQKQEALNNALPHDVTKDENGNVIAETYYWVSDFDDTYIYVEKSTWSETGGRDEVYGRFSYTFDETEITATISSDFEIMVRVWLTVEEKEKLDTERQQYEVIVAENATIKEQYSNLESVVVELKEYKETKENEIRKEAEDKIFAKFDVELSEIDDYKSLKENSKDYTIKQLEKECFALRGMYCVEKPNAETITFSVKKEKDNQSETPYGGLVEKYRKTN